MKRFLLFTTCLLAVASPPLWAQSENATSLSSTLPADVRIVCEAAKYAAILVTGDGGSRTQPGGILGNRHKLRDVVQILSPDEAVDFVRKKIRERDEFNAQFVKEYGGQLPPWTGHD